MPNLFNEGLASRLPKVTSIKFPIRKLMTDLRFEHRHEDFMIKSQFFAASR